MERPTKAKNQEQADELSSREKLLSQLEKIKQSVSTFEEHLPNIKSHLKNECDNFRAGRVAQFYENWQELTHDQEILRDIRGANIECNTTPQQHKLSRKQFSEDDALIIESEVEKLLSKGVIEPAQHEQGEILSNIFIRPKTDGTYRLILNLKEFNKNVSYYHFKMDTLNTIINLMSPDCYMASLDLKDAYYSIPVMKEHRKYLRFLFNGRLYQLTCLPNGLSSCPRKFTKTLKPILTTLHKDGHIASGYLDDIYLQGKNYNDCLRNIINTLKLFIKLGFIIHPTKSIFVPSKEIKMLGFILNSTTMTVRLMPEKKESIKSYCIELLEKQIFTIREIAKVIGKLVASFPGVMYGPLYYRQLEKEKILALKFNKGNFDASMKLSTAARKELQW